MASHEKKSSSSSLQTPSNHLQIKTEKLVTRKPGVPKKSAVYKCTQCPTTYLDRNLLLKHAADSHGRKIFQCPSCPNLYTDISNLARHTKSSHQNDKLVEKIRQRKDTHCNQCNLKFPNYSQLWMHKKKDHDNLKLYKCPNCLNEYTDRSNLKRHMKSHGSTVSSGGGGTSKIAIRLPKVYELEGGGRPKKKRQATMSAVPSGDTTTILEAIPGMGSGQPTGSNPKEIIDRKPEVTPKSAVYKCHRKSHDLGATDDLPRVHVKKENYGIDKMATSVSEEQKDKQLDQFPIFVLGKATGSSLAGPPHLIQNKGHQQLMQQMVTQLKFQRDQQHEENVSFFSAS